MKKILITGSSGFIGKNLCQTLKKLKYEILELDTSDGQIFNQSYFHQYENENISRLVHLAAQVHSTKSWNNNYLFYQTNYIGTLNALNFCLKKKIPITYFSTYVYGNQNILPIPETANTEPLNPYTHSKLAAEDLCCFYSKVHKIPVTIVRPFNVYGQGQDKNFIISSIVHQALNGRLISIGATYLKRDFIYIDDLINAVIKTFKQNELFNIYNIGSGVSYSIREVINIVQEILKIKFDIVSNKKIRKFEINDTVADISKISKEFDWKPKFSLREGLKIMLNSQE